MSNQGDTQGRAYDKVLSGEANAGLDDKLYKVKYTPPQPSGVNPDDIF